MGKQFKCNKSGGKSNIYPVEMQSNAKNWFISDPVKLPWKHNFR